uniref:Uncharacterized protein n=1 Tax=viral metagenome TaxID=1070528 RepID=A0A6C0HZP5_9ZZZZ
MSNLMEILNTGTKIELIPLIESMSDREILDICLNPANFNILYDKRRSYLFYDDDMEDEPNCILEALLECKWSKDLTKSKNCILTIFKIDKISQIIKNCDHLRRVSIYDRLIRCELISDEDIIAICGNCLTFIIKDYYDDGDIYYTYTELTDIFKYILENRPQYAKYLATIDAVEFSFWYYHLLEDKDDRHSEMFKELLLYDMLESMPTLDSSIIPYNSNSLNICYFDTILLIIEVVKKCSTKSARKMDITYNIFISLKIILYGILPPMIYDFIFTDKTNIRGKNIYLILAFCYLNIFEGANIECVEDFCQSIYIDDLLLSRIKYAIQLAIELSPNILHLKKYI